MRFAEQLEQIRHMGYRVTPQRQMILETLAEIGHHATALEVYDRITQKLPSINKTTVYRALDFLQEMNLATKSELNGRIYYEIADEETHHHLHCTECGNFTLLDNHHFERLVSHLADEHGFYADINHLVISGICHSCHEQQTTNGG